MGTTGKTTGVSSDSRKPGGGGHAAAAGIGFQANLGAWFASCHLLAERQLDTGLSGSRVLTISFETKAHVDDILIRTDLGKVFVQAKTNIALSDKPSAKLADVAGQFVRQFLACSSRDGDHSLHPDRDRFLLAVGPSSPQTISADLAQGLNSVQAADVAPLSMKRARAVQIVERQVARGWKTITGRPASKTEMRSIMNLVTVRAYDFSGTARENAEAFLLTVLRRADLAGATFSTIAECCHDAMANNTGFDLSELRRTLAAKGIPLNAPRGYRSDVIKLQEYSRRTRQHLKDHESIRVSGKSIHVGRRCTEALVQGTADGSLLIVGEPGSGKTGVLCDAASKLESDGADVLVLSVDRLSGTAFSELGLKNPLRSVLLNWPGNGVAYLFIDALDATRRADDDSTFRNLIDDVLSFGTNRWAVIASVRTFDLRQGREFRRLFRGIPPTKGLADPSLPSVAHILVRPWTPEEFTELVRSVPALAEAVDTGSDRIRELALVPFNTRLIADLITDGLGAIDFGDIRSQVQLLRLHWDSRIAKYGIAAERCLQATVSEMVRSKRLRARKLSVDCSASALDDLLRENVLVGVDDQSIAFRHHILFDYFASRVFLRSDDPAGTARLLGSESGVGFLLAPSVAFLLQALWDSSNDIAHRDFWTAVATICGEQACDPVARSVAARVASELPRRQGDTLALLDGPSVQADDRHRRLKTLRHVTGALVVQLGSQQHIPVDAWCELADCASDDDWIGDTLSCLIDLLRALCSKTNSETHLRWLGSAARRLLSYAFGLPSNHGLSSHAIEFVAITYRSDADASRRLLRRLFERDRFKNNADKEIPWLTRNLSPILAVDPDFIVEIYQDCYRYVIADETSTPVNRSQILRFSTSRRQDYESSWWNLKDLFQRLLEKHPLYAVQALDVSVSAYIEREHMLETEVVRELELYDGQGLLRDDGSYSWASDVSSSHFDADALVKLFVDHCLATDTDVIRETIEELIARSEYAVLWSCAFRIASQRSNEFGDLWALATQEPFLSCIDTRDAALSFIAARYHYEDHLSRTEFEKRANNYQFRSFPRPAYAKRKILMKLFSKVENRFIATEAARVVAAERHPTVFGRHQPVSTPIVPDFDLPPRWGVLRHQGVDVDIPSQRRILVEIDEVEQHIASTLW